jgi:ABC-type transport system substrate-binding protein
MIRFRLTQPLASFPDQLRIGLLPAHVFENVPVEQLDRHPFNLAPIGTGPYQLETLTASSGQIDGIQLRVAPVYRERREGQDGYWLDRVVFRTYPDAQAALNAFRQGEVNSISRIPYDLQEEAAQVPGLSLYTVVEPHVGVLIYNWERNGRLVRNPRARMALAHALDRTALVSDHLLGRAILADSPLLPGSWAYEAGLMWPNYDPALATALMETARAEEPPTEEEEAPAEDPSEDSASEEATAEPTPEATRDEGAETDLTSTPEATPDTTGVEGGEPGTEDETTSDEAAPTEEPEQAEPDFSILTLNDPALVALADDVAEGWTALGLEMDVEAVDAGELHARLETGDFGVALIELSFEPNADPDPYVFWHQGQYGSGQNFGAMDDRRISETLEMARRDPTGVNRVVHYHQFQELFAERVPALVLYYPLYIYAADTRLEGIQIGFLSSPSDRFRNMQDWVFAGTIPQ